MIATVGRDDEMLTAEVVARQFALTFSHDDGCWLLPDRLLTTLPVPPHAYAFFFAARYLSTVYRPAPNAWSRMSPPPHAILVTK